VLAAKSLDGRVAIITGGGTGIGLAIAAEYARLGARLVLASRNPEHLEPAARELASSGAHVLTVLTDVRHPLGLGQGGCCLYDANPGRRMGAVPNSR